MLIKIIAQRDFEIFFNYSHGKLYGGETMYPEDLQKALINTFFEKINNFCFQINNLCLYPKYTFDDKEIYATTKNKYIVLSDEIYDKYFLNCDDKNYNLHIIYNLPKADMVRLKRTDGDFPQDGSIDTLLTDYLEKSMVINLGQEFTLYFDCNDMKNSVNHITFVIDKIFYQNEIKKNINERLEEMNLTLEFNKNINNDNKFISIDKCENQVYNFSWMYATSKLNDVDKNYIGFVANSEVKIDFVVTEKPKEIVKTIIPDTKQLFDTPGLKCDDSCDVQKVLTREELRQKRLQAFNNNKTNLMEI